MSYPIIEVQNYDSVRNNIQNGDILLCSGNGVYSELIKKATDSVWSHVAFVLRLEHIDRVMVLESVETIGVRTIPLRNYIENYDGNGKGYDGRVFIYRHADFIKHASPATLNAMSQFAVDLLGYSYDKVEIARITARLLQKKLGWDSAQLPVRNKEFICSEYAWECYKSMGIHIPMDDSGFVVPAHFAKCPQTQPVAEIKI